MFAGLLVAVCIIFSVMSYFYTYVDPSQLDKLYQEDVGRGESDDEQRTKIILNENITKL